MLTEKLRILLLSMILLTSTGYAASSYREVARLHLGGDGGWDYLTVDPDSRRLYIARSDRLMVVDVDSGILVGEVTGLDGAHGVALLKDQGVGFATSGKSGEAVSFDLKTLKILQKTQAGENPDAIVYEPTSKRIFTFNGKSADATAIDPNTMKVIGKIALAGKPEFSAVDGKGRLFVNLENRSELLAIDPVQLKIVSHYDLKPCEEPTGLSIDAATERLIVGCSNRVAVIVNANTGQVEQNFSVGDGVDATAFDPQRKLAFISAGEGRLTILSERSAKFQLHQDLHTVKGARTLAVDVRTGRIFLPIAQFKPVSPGEKQQGHVRPTVIPGTFEVLVIGK
jgi:DNA-binding beta-propeller fold protein YncE